MDDIVIIRELRALTGQPASVINYALDRHGPQHAGRIGATRYWKRSDLPLILASLEKTAKRSSIPGRREAVAEQEAVVA